MPFGGLVSAIITAGYWPVFRNFLKDKLKCEPPSPSTVEPTTVQLLLVREIMSHLLNETSSLVKKSHYKIPITKLRDDDHLMDLLRIGVEQCQYEVVRAVLSTPIGQRFWECVKTGKYNSIKMELYILSLIKLVPPDLSRHLVGSHPLFELDYDRSTRFFFDTVFILCAGAKTNHHQLIYNLMLETEAEDIHHEFWELFHEVTFEVMLVPLSDASSVVRQAGNDEYRKYYTEKIALAAVSQSSDLSTLVTSFKTSIKLLFLVESSDHSIEVQKTRISDLLKICPETINPEGMVNAPRAVLHNFGGLHGHVGIRFAEISLLKLPLTAVAMNVLCVGDSDTAWSAAFLKLFPNIVIYNLSAFSMEGSASGLFSEIYAYRQEMYERFHGELTSSFSGDLLEEACRPMINHHLKDVNFGIILFNTVTVKSQTMIPTQFQGAVSYLLDHLERAGTLTVFITKSNLLLNQTFLFFDLPGYFGEFRFHISPLLSKVTTVLTLQYLRFQGIENRAQLTFFLAPTFQRLHNYFTHYMTPFFYDERLLTFFNSVVGTFPRLGILRISLSTYQSLFQSLVVNFEISFVVQPSDPIREIIRRLTETIQKEIAYVSAILVHPTSIPTSQVHMFRLMFEGLFLKHLLTGAKLSLQLEELALHVDVQSTKFDDEIKNGLEINKVPRSWSDLVGDQWLITDWNHYKTKLVQLFYWIVVRPL